MARLFRFFQWNDLHLRDESIPGRRGGYPRGNAKAAWARSIVRPRTGAVAAENGDGIDPPDFIASVGDLIDGELSDYNIDFTFMRRHLLADLSVPLLPCLGNHENRQGEGDGALNAAYDAFFGAAWHNYLYTVAGVGFIVIDASGGHRGPDPISDARLAFAQRALRHMSDRPCFVITHMPLIPVRDPEVLKRSFGFASWINLDARLGALVDDHAHHVIAVLSGHLHITGARQQRGVWQIVSSGTAGYPSNFASIDVHADHARVRMHAAPPELVGSPDSIPRGNLHGRERHGSDFTDSTHPDAESYVSGTAAERDFTITLTEAQRPDPLLAREPLRVWHEITPGDFREAALLWNGTSHTRS